MPMHDCETYDFPVKKETFNYSFEKKVVMAAGGTWQMAVQEAIDEAKSKATAEGEDAMKDEKCAKPCERLIYVDITIDGPIRPTWKKKGKTTGDLVVNIAGIWQAGILCFKNPPASGTKEK